MTVGKNITWKKGKGEQYYLAQYIQAARKNIEWRKGERKRKLGGRYKDKKEGLGKNIKLQETLYTPEIVIINMHLYWAPPLI